MKLRQFGIEIRWGLWFSAAVLLWLGFEKFMGWHDAQIEMHAIYTNLFAIVAMTMYFFALKDKRDTDYEGKISWKQAFISGIVLSVVITLLSPVMQHIGHTYISPEYFPNIIEYVVDKGRMSQDEAENYFSLKSYIMQSAFGALTMGVVTAAIVALFVKKQ
ncbi:MAG: DUF4199 domain-containing protein [Cellulophaga sp.]